MEYALYMILWGFAMIGERTSMECDIHMKNQDYEENQNPGAVIWECSGKWRVFYEQDMTWIQILEARRPVWRLTNWSYVDG